MRQRDTSVGIVKDIGKDRARCATRSSRCRRFPLRRGPRWIIPTAVVATLRAAEVTASWMLPGKGTHYIGIDIYMVVIGLGFSAVSAAWLVTGSANTLTGWGSVSRDRTPIAYCYNVVGFGLLGHAIFCIGVSRLTHPLMS